MVAVLVAVLPPVVVGVTAPALDGGLLYLQRQAQSVADAAALAGAYQIDNGSGNGVFIDNTGGGTINLSGTGTISLKPMRTGTYAGITIFRDRTNSAGATMSGGSNISNTGTFRFPGSTVTLSGTGSVGVMGAQFIVEDLTFSGTSGVKVNFDTSVVSSSILALVQ
jgi:hypothetical protein